MIRVGTILYGYCYGHFGRDSYDEKRVAREDSGQVVFADVAPEELTVKPPDDF